MSVAERRRWYAVRHELQQLGWQPGHRGWWVEYLINGIYNKGLSA